MKKIIILLLGISFFSSYTFAGGGCYQDPIVQVNYMAKITTAARLRNNPCMAGTTVITVLPLGEVVQVVADNDGWIQVKRTDGTTGRVGTWLTSRINQVPPKAPVNTDDLYTTPSQDTTYYPSKEDAYFLSKIYKKIDDIADKYPEKIEDLRNKIQILKNKYKYKARLYYILGELENYLTEKLDFTELENLFDI